MTDKPTMPTREEIHELKNRLDTLFTPSPTVDTAVNDASIMFRRIADAMEGCVMVPKEVVDDAIIYLRIAAEYDKGINFAPLVEVANKLTDAKQRHCSISRKAFPELDCDTPVYMREAAQGQDHE